jgi:DNA-binding MarR family transcriptional regulator
VKNIPEDSGHSSVGAWAKRCYFAGREVMDRTLRPYDLGSTQWYVLWQLANVGPTTQRDLGRLLSIERASLSGIVATLLRKNFVCQVTDSRDQRVRLLQLTDSGKKLWDDLPDLTFIRDLAFADFDADAIGNTIKVLQTATERLESYLQKGSGK